MIFSYYFIRGKNKTQFPLRDPLPRQNLFTSVAIFIIYYLPTIHPPTLTLCTTHLHASTYVLRGHPLSYLPTYLHDLFSTVQFTQVKPIQFGCCFFSTYLLTTRQPLPTYPSQLTTYLTLGRNHIIKCRGILKKKKSPLQQAFSLSNRPTFFFLIS